MSRALRRHHRARLMRTRKNYHNWGLGREPDKTRIARYVDTPCPCSCDGCGNQRYAFRRNDPTIQELRFFASRED